MTTRRAGCALTFLAMLGALAASAAPAVAGCTEPADASTVKRSLSRRADRLRSERPRSGGGRM